MSCVHYKFKSSLDYQSVTFDGIHISLGDLKKAIILQKKMKSGEFDLEITNAQTGDVYKTDDELIPKNSSVIVSRIPVKASNASSTQKAWEAFKEKCAKAMKEEREQELLCMEKLKETGDLANAQATEIDKIKAMIDQSTRDFDPSNYRGKHPTGPPPPGYHCHRCGKPGHYIHNCNAKMDDSKLHVEPRFKRSTGIPASFLTLTDDPNQPGALLTHTGQFAVPTIDALAYAKGKKERPPFLPDPVDEEPQPQHPPVPKELLCTLCNNLLTNAVVISCCGVSYCDECICDSLLESEDRACPSCGKMDMSPDQLIANIQLRTAVTNFLNETGYTVAMFKKKELTKQEAAKTAAAAAAAALNPPQTVTPPSLSQMEVVKAQLEMDQQYGRNSPSTSSLPPRGSHRDHNRAAGRPLTVLGAGGSCSPPDHQSRPYHSTRERYQSRHASYPHHKKWSENQQYHSSHGHKSEPLLPRPSAPVHGPAPVTLPGMPFTSGPPLLSSLGIPPKPLIPTPQPLPPAGPLNGYITGVTAPPSTFAPAIPPPFAAPPPTVPPPQLPPFAPPFGGPVIPGVVIRPPVTSAPLTEQEFYREKQRLLEESASKKDVYEEFANFVKRDTKRRPRSHSGSPGSSLTPRRRSRSYSRSRSRSPSPSRSFRSSRSSLKRSRSPRSRSPRPLTPRSRTPRSQSFSPIRSRSRGRLRTRTRSRTPLRSLSRSPRSRLGKRYRSRSRSYSRSPIFRSPRRSRSRSRSRVRGRSPFRRPYRSSSRSLSRSRSPSPPFSRSLSRSPRRRRSPRRFGRKRTPSLSRSRSKSPFKEPLGAPTRPNWRSFHSPPPAGRGFPPQTYPPRYPPPGPGPLPNGPDNFFNSYQRPPPLLQPGPYMGQFYRGQFPNQPGHAALPPLMQGLPRLPAPPFDRQFYDNRGPPPFRGPPSNSPPFRGPASNSPPMGSRAKSPLKTRMPLDRRQADRREARDRGDVGDRRNFGKRDGLQRREGAPGERREGSLRRRLAADAASAPAAGDKSHKVKKVKRRPVDGKKENRETRTDARGSKEGAAKTKDVKVPSKSRHSSGTKHEKPQESKTPAADPPQEVRKPPEPSSEKPAAPAAAPAKEGRGAERGPKKVERSKERPRKVVSASADTAKAKVPTVSTPPSADAAVRLVPSSSDNVTAEAPPPQAKVKVKKRKIKVKDPVVASTAGSQDDVQKKLLRLKRFQAETGEEKEVSPPKKAKREPTPPGLGKPMDLRLGPVEAPNRHGQDYNMPELSKWERDDVSRSPTEHLNPRRKVVEKKPLPRSVIEKAESALANKPLKPSVKPSVAGSSPVKQARRVYVEDEASAKVKETEERKASNAMQITVSKSQRRVSESRPGHSSDKQRVDADVRRVAKSDHHRRGVSDSDHHKRTVPSSDSLKRGTSDSERHKRVSTDPERHKRVVSESDHHKRVVSDSDHHRRAVTDSDQHKHTVPDSDNHRHGASSSDHRRSEDTRHVTESRIREKSSHIHTSHGAKQTDASSSSSKPVTQEKGKVEEKPPAVKGEKIVSSDGASSGDGQKPRESKPSILDRKESMIDEATFEPDYDEQSGSESSNEETTTAGEQISTMSSGSHTDQSCSSPSKRRTASTDASGHHKKSKKKHKHKNKHKHKHKKKKHKKNKERDAESEDA